MNKLISVILPVTLFFLQACSKDGDSAGGSGGKAINSQELAKATFDKINTLWTAVLKPGLGQQTQTYSGKVLQGSEGGKATVNGAYQKNSSSSATSTLNSSTMDVFITFDQYRTGDLLLNGTIRFYEHSYSRTACSSSGCASSSKRTLAYESRTKLSDTALTPFNIEFAYNDGLLKDFILMDSHKEYSSWKVEITNADKTTFTFSF